MRTRRLEPEIMDDPALDADEHEAALRGLSRLNVISRSVAPFWRRIEPLLRATQQPLTLIDLACGGGDLAIGLARRAHDRRLPLRVTGCDFSGRAIAFSRRRAASLHVNADFFEMDVLRDRVPRAYDIVVNSLFVHHLTRQQAISFLRSAAAVANRLLLVDDLIRSRGGWVAAQAATKLVSRSAVVRQDGPQSVRAAFTTSEFSALARESGLQNAEVCRHWPFRQMLEFRR
ncbi:MAG: methyltransferase domain-containing protein [Phycisphaerae bacterium]